MWLKLAVEDLYRSLQLPSIPVSPLPMSRRGSFSLHMTLIVSDVWARMHPTYVTSHHPTYTAQPRHLFGIIWLPLTHQWIQGIAETHVIKCVGTCRRMSVFWVCLDVLCSMLRVYMYVHVSLGLVRCMNGMCVHLCVYVRSVCFVSMSGCDENGCLACVLIECNRG